MARKTIRLVELFKRGPVKNHPTYKRWVRDLGFPPGFMLGPNTRVIFEDEIEAWEAERQELDQRNRESA